MHTVLEELPERILRLAVGALTQANTHAVFQDPGNEHWRYVSVLNAAHAGELFLKAAIAKAHPLLIFKDIFALDDKNLDVLDIGHLIKRGKTHDFEKLPEVLWVTTGRRIPDPAVYERLRKARNAVQHFCEPEDENLRSLALEFIYKVIDPIIADEFGLVTIDYHEDHHIGYDYVVGAILRAELKFTIPDDFIVSEISLDDELRDVSPEYRSWFDSEMLRVANFTSQRQPHAARTAKDVQISDI